MPQVSIVGTTSWGITLAVILASKGLETGLLVRTEQEASALQNGNLKRANLPVSSLPANLRPFADPREALNECRVLILAVPSQTMRQNVHSLSPFLKSSTILVSAAKGLEIGTQLRMSQVIAAEIDPHLRHNICVLSGPNLSREILQGLPAATVAAAEDTEVSRAVQRILTTPNLCVYTHNDVIGVELGGSFKNIIALGAGMADGLGYGDNAKAAFITRGLTEITALGVALGAHPLTFSGLAGLGDVITTCASTLSRNHYLGVELTKGRTLEEITRTMDGVAEGVATTKVAWELAQNLELEMPITEKIYQVLYAGLSPRKGAAQLMLPQNNHELTGRKWNLFSFFTRRKHP
jgi:glycerol-3-phosphate dehydrogenase (NAD(P)+)